VKLAKEMATHPMLGAVILYYAIRFGIVLAVYHVYMNDASLTHEDIEMLFFVFGISPLATLLFVPRV
jgi:hypothetical protein